MRNVLLLGVTLLVGLALIGCGGGVSKEKVEKTWKDYYGALLKGAKEKKEVKGDEAYAKAAKDNGFKDWNDFTTKATKALGADEWTKATKKASDWYTAELKKITDAATKEAGEKTEEKTEGEGEGGGGEEEGGD